MERQSVNVAARKVIYQSLWRLCQIEARRLDKKTPHWWNNQDYTWTLRLDPTVSYDRIWLQLIRQRQG